MKKVSIKNYKTNYECFKNIESDSDIQLFIDHHLSLEMFFKPEREIVALSETYEESDVKSSRSEEINGVTIDYVTLKAEGVITIEDITDAYNAEQALMQDLANGQKAEAACKQVKAYVTGYNLRRQLTSEQVSLLIVTFANINLALDNFRPPTARILIEAATVDGEVVTQELKDNCLLILTRNGF